MNSRKEKTHSFIVRVWLESREIKGALPQWRGEVKHVTSGKQIYLKNLTDITSFITPYLEEMGIKFTRRKKLTRWLSEKLALFC
jgi:hypothetical protein